MDNPQALPLGTRLAGEYRIERVLGSGGFGITYLAEEETLQRKVAIKEYFPTGLAAREGSMLVRSKGNKGKGRYIWGLDRFIHEAQILAKFNHDNIVRVFRYFRENNTAYMVLHYEEGKSLKVWLDSLGRAPMQPELDAILEKILPALETLHDADYLHRDIAPDNILVREDGAPVLIDFGSARGEVAQHSKTVSAIVKPGYSPFEQYALDGKQQGPWTDIYSLGATLYYAISRRRPLDAPGRVSNDKHKSAFEAARGHYRKGFLEAIDLALQVTPEQRPAHIADWRELLFEADTSPTFMTVKEEVPAGQKRDIVVAEAAVTAKPGATRAAGTMPLIPTFLRKRKSEPKPELEPVFDTPAPSANNQAARAKIDSLGQRLAQVTPNEETSGKNYLAGDNKSKSNGYFDNWQNTPGADGAAALPDHVDIPLTRMVRAAQGAGSRTGAYIYGLLKLGLSIPYRIIRAFITVDETPVRKNTPSPQARVQTQTGLRLRPAGLITLCSFLMIGIAVNQNWIPDRWMSEARSTIAGVQEKWPGFKVGIEQTYTSTLASVQKIRQVLNVDEEISIGEAKVLRGHEGMVQSAVFTPDGKFVISGGIDERLRIWNVRTGRLRRQLSKEQGSITALDIRHNKLLMAQAGGYVVVKNWRSGKVLKKVRHHSGLVRAVSFSKLGSEFFSAGQDGIVKLWNEQSDAPDLMIESGSGAVHAIAVRPSRNQVAAAGADRSIRIWDISRQRLIRKFRGHKRAVSSIDFSPAGKYLVTAGLDGRLKLWSTQSSRTRRTLHGHKGRIYMAKFSPDGSLIASGGEDGTVRLWNVRRRKLLRTFRGHEGAVRSVAFSNDGRKIVSGSDDGTVRIWTIRPNRSVVAGR